MYTEEENGPRILKKGIGAMNESQPYKVANGAVNASNQVLIRNSKDDYILIETPTILYHI